MKRASTRWSRLTMAASLTAVVAGPAAASPSGEAGAPTDVGAGPHAQYAAPVTYPSGTRPWGMSLEDLNADRHLDLVTVNGGDNEFGSVSVLLGTGDGTFGAKVDYTIPTLPFDGAVVDFDEDGDADIAVSGGSTRGTVTLLRNDGTGGFTVLPATLAVGYAPNAVDTADVDRDGHQDLVTANYFAGTVSVLLGRGDGTFHPERHFSVGPTPQGLRLVDTNGDGRLDIVTGGFGLPEASLTVLLGTGDGGFTARRDHAAGESVNDAVAADFNRDRRTDAITGEFVTNQVSILLADRHGRLGPRTTMPTGAGINSLTVADVNADGKLDVLSNTTPTRNRVPTDSGIGGSVDPDNPGGFSVLHGNGDGTFQQHVLYPIEGSVSVIGVADLDHDGDLDVAGVLLDKSVVAVWRNSAVVR